MKIFEHSLLRFFILNADWLQSGEAREILAQVFDPQTKKPTESGLGWLNQAGVDAEDIMLLESAGAVKKAKAKSQQKYIRVLQTASIHINQTLSLLRVA